MTDEQRGPVGQEPVPEAPRQRRPPAGRAERGPGGATPVVLGALLVVAGLILLIGQELDIGVQRLGWPLFVIGPGIVLLVIGLSMRHGAGLAAAGGVVTVTGLLLLYQNATAHWESWAYAWALAAPGGIGLGLLAHGATVGDSGELRQGLRTSVISVVLFAVGVFFFEGVLDISGRRLPVPDWVLPVALIALGALVVLSGVRRRTPRSD